MKRVLLAGLLFLAFIMVVGLFAGGPTKVSTSDQILFKDQVLKTLGPTPSSWNVIQFEEVGERSFRLALVYSHMPSNLQQVENDTRRIARAVLKVLVEKGRSPHQEMISVFVHAQIPEKGETGANMVRYFGKTMYDYNDDQLVFKPAKY
ncbi:MAG: hypothetical protein ABL970_14685 [Nitrospira sp.]